MPRPAPPPKLLPVLLLVSVTTTLVAAYAGFGWWRSAQAPVTLDELPANDRQRLVSEVQRVLPGVHQAAWFQPEIGYTLRPDAIIEAWDDVFRSNAIGYRTGPVHKASGVFRVLFVGDSWTYGMGIREEESFPKVLERLANRHAGVEQRIEAWTLALPGYNLINEIAAFDFWFGRLRPNAVVFVPSSNDNHSSASVLPGGELFYGAASGRDRFGSPHPHAYRVPWPLDSFVYRQRWRLAWERLRLAEEKLAYYRVPSFLLFLAVWDRAIVHQSVHDAGLRSRYTIVPPELTLRREWVNASEDGHGNPAANERYAQLVYRLLAPALGWRALPEALRYTEVADVPLFEQPPPEPEWRAAAESIQREGGRRFIPRSFRAGEGELAQWPGAGNVGDGTIGRAATVLVRPREGTQRLRVRLARLESVRALYPIEVEVSIPGPDGESRRALVLEAGGPEEVEIELEVPQALRDGRVLDVIVEAGTVAAIADTEVAGSLRIVSVEAAD
ncbi:MAG TPA: hypothetical protein VMT85_18835 [Thermoanaerobaculia bacterium]|nr:hypothetical protein [Thermoanaerobaculia bacterium]